MNGSTNSPKRNETTQAPRGAGDPIFAAIEAHRAACTEFWAVQDECFDGYIADVAYMARARRAVDQLSRAYNAMRSTVPRPPP